MISYFQLQAETYKTNSGGGEGGRPEAGQQSTDLGWMPAHDLFNSYAALSFAYSYPAWTKEESWREDAEVFGNRSAEGGSIHSQ